MPPTPLPHLPPPAKELPWAQRLADRVLLFSLLVAAAFWLLESLLQALVIRPAPLLTHLLPADRWELITRLAVVNAILAAGLLVRVGLKRRFVKELESILDGTNDAYLAVDNLWRLTFLNRRAEELFGVSRADVLGKGLWDTLPEAASVFYKPFQRAMRESGGRAIEGYYSAKRRHLEVNVFPQPGGLAIYFRDVTEQRQRERALTENYQRLQTILDNASDGIITISGNGLIETFNKAAQRIFGYGSEEVIGHNVSLLMPEHHARCHDDYITRYLRTRVPRILGLGAHEVEGRRKDGSLFPLEIAVSEMHLGEALFFIGILRDVTDRKRSQAALEFMSNYDSLTGLPNRSLLRDRLAHAIRQAHRRENLVAVMFLDLDRFKNINDTLGHSAGDRLLKTVATRLAECVGEEDTVARLGGDEFVIVLESIAHVDTPALVADRILKALARPVSLLDHEVIISASIGITIYPFDEDNIDDLLKDADTAMYRAKERGRNNYQYFTADMTAMALEHLALEQDLRRALERGEFELYYQPLVEIAGGRVVGTEALLRWHHPERGDVPPQEFIPLLEDTGLILSVGEWVLREACRQAVAWHREGFEGLAVAVNLSARQFHQKGLPERVARVLQETGLGPSCLELEITESLLVDNLPSTSQTVARLHALGVKFSIDDFGTGYSSMSYLKRFPVNTLKIDQSFTRDIPGDADSASIARAIIALGRSLRLEVVAEGVETQEQLAFLRAEGCDRVQGYLFCRPQPAREIAEWLRSRRPVAEEA